MLLIKIQILRSSQTVNTHNQRVHQPNRYAGNYIFLGWVDCGPYNIQMAPISSAENLQIFECTHNTWQSLIAFLTSEYTSESRVLSMDLRTI